MIPVSFDGWTVTNWDEMSGFSNGRHLFTCDELQDLEIQNTEETQDVTGANGVVLNTTKKNKGCSGTGTNGVLSGGLLALQVGSAQTTSGIIVKQKDTFVVTATQATAGTLTLTKTPTGVAGSEIGYAYITDPETEVVTTLEQGTTVSATKFTYSTGTITFDSGVLVEGQTVVVYYKVALAANKGVQITNDSTKYSGECELIFTGTATNACGKTAAFEFIVPRADFTGNFNFTKGDAQMVHSFEWKALKNKCATVKKFWDFIIYSDED